MEAAMHTAVPTISAVALPAISVQSSARKIRLVNNSVAIVIPDVGLLVTPTIPTIREATVTKKKAAMAIKIAATVRIATLSRNPRIPGTSTRINSTTHRAAPTTGSGRSRSVRCCPDFPLTRMFPIASRND